MKSACRLTMDKGRDQRRMEDLMDLLREEEEQTNREMNKMFPSIFQ